MANIVSWLNLITTQHLDYWTNPTLRKNSFIHLAKPENPTVIVSVLPSIQLASFKEIVK